MLAEVESATATLNTPAARLIEQEEEQSILLKDVDAVLAADALAMDACRYAVRNAHTVVSLATRPVLFTLVRALAEARPGDVPRDMLVMRAFRAKRADESHRARLRVEMGQLRKLLPELAGVSATARGSS